MAELTTIDNEQERLARLGAALADEGFARHTEEVATLVAQARRRGVASVAVDVLADPSEPDVARYRAFARVVAALVATAPAATGAAMTPAA